MERMPYETFLRDKLDAWILPLKEQTIKIETENG